MGEKKDDLIKIVGMENVIDTPEVLEAYSRDYSFARPMKPRLVVRPKNSDEVQGIVKWANHTGTPLVPVSSDFPHFRGDTVPSIPETIIVDLSRMKRIVRIDRRNRVALIEPGVTFGQLQPELAKEGMRLTLPLLPRSNKSVVTSLLEREPTLVPKYNWQIPEPLRCLEVVFGSGDILKTGEAGDHGPLEEQWKMGWVQTLHTGPRQTDFYRLVQAAQGTMGIVTWASIRCEILPQIHELFFVQSHKLDNLLDFAYRLLRIRYADEFLFLNNSNLASMIGEGPEEIMTLKKDLPQWILILGVAGRDLFPKERVEFQEKDIADIAQQFGLQVVSSIPGASDKEVLKALLTPCEEPYWKLRYKGGCQDIFFLTTLDKTPGFVETMYALLQASGYSPLEIGIYIQPVHQGVACHCEFSLPYDLNNQREVARIQRLVAEGSKALMDQGAFFSRPYGLWADMVYNRDAQTTVTLKKVKGIFDPNNVMNPGKLCF
jgi:FAD/FMN-containing dehydrogenase